MSFQKLSLSLQKNRIDMQTTRTIFNPVQMHLLEMFNYCKSENAMNELKEVLSDYYAKKSQEEADRLWENSTLDDNAIEKILSEHIRTPYTV